MINFIELTSKLRAHKIMSDSLMPWAYQFANPNGRPYHDDWGIMTSNSVLKFVQPWQRIRRMDTAFCVPLPFRKVAGTQEPIWTPVVKDWPVVAGTEVRYMPYNDGEKTVAVPHILTMHPIYDSGWSRQEAYIGGQWVECYYTSSKRIFGRRVTHYYGLRLDPHPVDLMCWYPEASFSIKKRA